MEHRVHFFPQPFPDETLHSLMTRYGRLSGLGSNKTPGAALWKGSFSDNVPFPCQLGDLVRAIPAATGLNATRLIANHTLLPYYQPFLSGSQLSNAKFQMEHGTGNGLHLKLGLTASRLEIESRVRLCQKCIEHDRVAVGVAYWHRAHQLPGVLMCPLHKVPLVVFDHRHLNQFRRMLLLPEDDAVMSSILPLELAPACLAQLGDIAKSSYDLLSADSSPLDAGLLRDVMMNGAIRAGVASEGRRLRLGELANLINAYLDSLPRVSEYNILKASTGNSPAAWVTKLLRKPRRTHHPLKFIVLSSALSIHAEELLNAGGVGVATAEVKAERDTQALLPAGGSSLTNTLERNFQFPPKLAKAICKCAEAGLLAPEIASKLSVSLSTVYRGIRAQVNGAKRWRVCKLNKVRFMRRARFDEQYRSCLARECCDYAWLNRHDSEWLSNRCAVKGQRRQRESKFPIFSALDPVLAQQILQCARRLLNVPGKPIWINCSRIGRELHSAARLDKQLGKLPQCAAALAAVCETRPQFHRRRLIWAEEQLLNEGRHVTQSALYKRASIRPRIASLFGAGPTELLNE